MATIKTPLGLTHSATKGFYSGEIAETGILPQPVGQKRGRGRPRSDAGETGAAYDFSGLVAKIKVPAFKGTSRVYAKMDK